MNKKTIFILFFLFLLSRIVFINTKNIFFDSTEYIDLFSHPNYITAIISGHAPPHEGYIILFWPIFHAAKFFQFDPVYTVILGQIIFAFLTIYCFYHVVLFITNRNTALFASIIITFIPIFWILNVAIMMEIAYIGLFFISLYFLIRYLTIQKKLQLHISLLFFGLAFLTHPMVIIWIPFYLALVFYKKKEKLFFSFSMVIFYLVGFLLLNTFFIALNFHTDPLQTAINIYAKKGGEFANIPTTMMGVFISIRNFIIPLLRNNTSLLIILGFVSLLLLFKKNKRLFFLSLLWIMPAFYANQWWDSLLNGRHAIIASFGFAFLAAYLVRKRLCIALLLLLYLLTVSLPILQLLKRDIPYVIEAEFVKSLPEDSLLIDTHFARPQIEKTFSGKLLTVNEPAVSKDMIQKTIDDYLKEKKPIFISSGALSEPYGLYSGPYVHNITLSYAKPFALQVVLSQYTLETYKVLNKKDNLIMYKLVSAKPSPYPNVLVLRDSYRRLDYYDPLWRVYVFLTEKKTLPIF